MQITVKTDIFLKSGVILNSLPRVVSLGRQNKIPFLKKNLSEQIIP